MRRSSAGRTALGGVLAALALVIMCLGGLIPVATYVLPILCCLLAQTVLLLCGKRVGWAWYAVVSLLSLLMGPDKEAALIFFALGYYPLIRHKLNRGVIGVFLKFLVFNVSILLVYGLLLGLLGIDGEMLDTQFGWWGLLGMLFLGNATFFLLDRLLLLTERKFSDR